MFDLATWVVTPLAGAVIGYSTNVIAIKMLFRPLTEKRLFGIRLPFTPGLIPKERYALSKKIADTIGNHLLTEEAITEALSSEGTMETLTRIIDDIVSKLEADTDTLNDKFNKYVSDDIKAVFGEFLFNQNELSFYAVSKHLPLILGKISQQLNENQGLDNAIRGVIVKLIEDNVGSLMGMFVNPNKTYDKMKKGFIEYIDDPQNNDKIYLQLYDFFNEAMQANDLEKNIKDFVTEKIMSIQVCELTLRFISPNKDKLSGILVSSAKPLAAKLASGIAGAINVKDIVRRKMDDFEVGEAENIILSVVNKELKLITAIGGVLGFIIGLLPGIIGL